MGRRSRQAICRQCLSDTVSAFCLQYDLTLVTQDGNLAQDVLDIKSAGRCRSASAFPPFALPVMALLIPGEMRPNRGYRNETSLGTQRKKSTPAFQLRSGVARIDAAPLPLTRPAAEGDLLFTARQKPPHLGKTLGRGGEGTVFLTDTDQVCKTYGPKPPRGLRGKSWNACARIPCSIPVSVGRWNWFSTRWGRVCRLSDAQASGHELQHSVMHPKLLEETFPEWNRLQLVRLAITILKQSPTCTKITYCWVT